MFFICWTTENVVFQGTLSEPGPPIHHAILILPDSLLYKSVIAGGTMAKCGTESLKALYTEIIHNSGDWGTCISKDS